MRNKNWSEMSWWQKILVALAAMTQIGLFVIASIDLTLRDPERVNGSKKVWRFVLFINFIGPLLYFKFGRK